MPDTPPNRNEPVSAAVQRRIRWDAVAAIIAALIGLLALLVSGYTAYVQRQQVRAQVWPYVELFESDNLPNDAIADGAFVSHGGSLQAINDGVGPAIVHNVEVLVNDKPQPDWAHVFKALGFQSELPHGESSFNHRVLPPGTTLNFLLISGSGLAIARRWAIAGSAHWISGAITRRGNPSVPVRGYPRKMSSSSDATDFQARFSSTSVHSRSLL